ncbi:MAG: amidase [Ilumatobacteraceae bacterium]|jgi:aspartyl-tRNA(Asn)/glutamyl-tRNA(Gln) amidotransferase subunit A
MPELYYDTAHEVLEMFRNRELSPMEYLESLIERIETHDPQINAVVDRRYDEARAEARASEQRYLGKGDAPRPLEGLCIAAKEEHPMAGRSWRQGSLAFADDVAKYDHPIIERIQAAGGVIHIRTATPEFSCAGFTHSKLWGVTRNPWNTEFAPGGSSGGSAAALAAGFAPLATGSDIGGSIRIPASFCGVTGFKPPFGRVPGLAPYHLDQYCHDGPLARTVADCGLLENVIAGPHWRDNVSLRDPPQIPRDESGVTGVRVGLSMTLGNWPVDADVVANTGVVAESLRKAGAIVEEVALPWTVDRFWQATRAHFAAIFGPGIGHIEAEHGELLNDYTRAFVATMNPELTFYEGLVEETALWDPLGRLFEDIDILLCPTTATTGLQAGNPYLDEALVINGEAVGHHILGMMTVPFNLFSRCPVLSVPSGLASNGVPTGVQIVGRTYEDVSTFQVGAAIEAAGFGFGSPDWRPPLSY